MYHLVTGKAPEGFYTAKEIEDQLNDATAPIPAEQRWFFELIKINLAEDINERYSLGAGDQGRPGQASGDARGQLPEVPAGEQGARAVLHRSVPSR